jgi:hypothetical protein
MRRESRHQLNERRLCRISYWQGYVTGRYYAHDGDPSRAVRFSQPFRTWTLRHGNVDPRTLPAARAALQQLETELHALGWRVAGREAATHSAPASKVAHPAPPVLATRDPASSDEANLDSADRVASENGAAAAAHALSVVEPVPAEPATRAGDAFSDEAILGALDRVASDGGATAADVGRELLGDEANVVRHVPQRVAARLRRLQIQGKVERRKNGRAAAWFPSHRKDE